MTSPEKKKRRQLGCVVLLTLLACGCAPGHSSVATVDPSAGAGSGELDRPESGAVEGDVEQAEECCPAGYWGVACEFCDPDVAGRTCTPVAFTAERLEKENEVIWLGTDNQVFRDVALGAKTDPDGTLMNGIWMQVERVVQGDLKDGHVQVDSSGHTTLFWELKVTPAPPKASLPSRGSRVFDYIVIVDMPKREIPRRGFFRVHPFRPEPTAGAVGWIVAEQREALEERCPPADPS